MSVLIAIDVGNSRVKLSLIALDDISPGSQRLPECRSTVVLDSPAQMTADRLRAWAPSSTYGSVHGVIAATSPQSMQRIRQAWPEEWALTTIENTPDFPVLVATSQPRRVGVDRLLNAVAANRVRDPDQPAIVVDTGTAITVDLVLEDGSFAGGAILPGVKMSARALHEYTAALPLVTIDDQESKPAALGRRTESALQSGLYWGHLGAIREIIFRITSDLPRHSRAPRLLFTGGAAATLTPHFDRVDHLPHLTLQGLAIVWRLQRDVG